MKDALEKFEKISEGKQGALFRSLELKRVFVDKKLLLLLKDEIFV